LWYLHFLDVLDFARNPAPQDLDEGQRLETVLMVLGFGHTAVMIITAVVFLIWLYRSYANLQALWTEGHTYAPGWAVGYYFIPILNLFRPCQVMQETWKGSDP